MQATGLPFSHITALAVLSLECKAAGSDRNTTNYQSSSRLLNGAVLDEMTNQNQPSVLHPKPSLRREHNEFHRKECMWKITETLWEEGKGQHQSLLGLSVIKQPLFWASNAYVSSLLCKYWHFLPSGMEVRQKYPLCMRRVHSPD